MVTRLGPVGLGFELGDELREVGDGWIERDLYVPRGLDGPEGVLQGGFAVGLAGPVAHELDTTGAQLTSIDGRLHAPTPLGRDLSVRARPLPGAGRYEVQTRDGASLLVASTVELAGHEVGAPPADLVELGQVPVPAAQPQEAFPRCFVCGPHPTHELALRLHPHPVGPDAVSIPVVFDDGLADGDRVDVLAVSAVLDCPGVWASYDYVRSIGHQGALLGGFRLTFFRDVPLMEPLRAVGRLDTTDGRKIRARVGLVDDDGVCYAMSSGLHLSVAEIPAPPA